MAENQKFFICKHCGNLVGMVLNHNVPLSCCGEQMTELVPNTVEASAEKHLPQVVVDGDTITVSVGSVLHPMLEEHHIQFVYIETENGGQRKSLKIGEDPIVKFSLVDDKLIAVYEYCNLHGLWKTEVE